MSNKKISNITPFGLRLQPGLKAELEACAKSNERSLNAEIVERLETSLDPRLDLSTPSDGELIDELIRRWGREQVFIRLGKNNL